MTSEIPNITGGWALSSNLGATYYPNIVTGAFEVGATTGNTALNASLDVAPGYVININASRCSDRYGNYTEVNPLYESCKYIIRY